MGNEFRGLPGHSAEWFGDTRDYWWNADFIAFIARSWQLDAVRSVLDMGCGVGHWGRVLLEVLPPAARILGIDREPLWLEKARERAGSAGLGERLEYRHLSAESLPFADATFDLTTCQTLLMHVPDPARVLAEMVRVTRPGGLLVVAEANNSACSLLDGIALGDSPETTSTLVHFQLVCEQGKRRLAEGSNSIGEALPQLLHSAGLNDVQVRHNDRTSSLVPPYSSPFERAHVEEALDLAERGFWMWDEATTRRYFLAGGGTEAEFARNWAVGVDQFQRRARAIRAGTYACSGGGLHYLAWGRRRLA
jgi:ubiquinone/menaquinone biosynthesis C-methylase UbiE